MFMPFIRLVAIYAVVILAGLAFFNRDTIAAMTDGMSIQWWPWSNSAPEAAQVQPAKEGRDADSAAPERQTVAEDAPARPTANSPIRMPVADPDPVEKTPESGGETGRDMAGNETGSSTRELAIRMPVADAPGAESDEGATAVAPSIQPAPLDPAARLAEARGAYWAGDIAGAQALYAAMVRDLPDSADAWGEYGNILYGQRRYSDAADAYLATGKLLIGDGKIAQAQPIIAVLDAIAPQKAASLRAMAADQAARN